VFEQEWSEVQRILSAYEEGHAYATKVAENARLVSLNESCKKWFTSVYVGILPCSFRPPAFLQER
jgi:hypothetical protein